MNELPAHSVAAPAPTWEREVDVVVVGSGAAGLAAALAVRPVRSALIVTKGELAAGSTAWAQGGLAAVLDPTDSLENHVRDTLAAGAGLCDEAVVRELVAEAPTAIRYLMRLGAAFDPAGHDGDRPALGREGGHSHHRIVHSGGDRSGAEVQRTLDQSALAAGVEVLERAFALDAIVGSSADGKRQAAGIRVAMLDADGSVTSVGVVRARAVVLATGGYGQVFASTSNPPAVTGDGVAMAMRAGLEVSDVEFVQFHPTVMWSGPDAAGQQALVSEAVRGEGAILYDGAGRRVMAGVHPQEDLAPRDVVAAAISRRMAEAPGGVDDHVYLDATSMGERFYDALSVDHRGVPLDRDRSGAGAHPRGTSCPLRLRGRAGEARRDHRAARPLRRRRGFLHRCPRGQPPGVEQPDRERRRRHPAGPRPRLGAARRGRRRGGGAVGRRPRRPGTQDDDPHGDVASRRSAPRRRRTRRRRRNTRRGHRRRRPDSVPPSQAAYEATNVATVARALLAAATARTESRGCHRRSDHPEPRPEWVTHLHVGLASSADGEPVAVVGGPRPTVVAT